MSDFLQHVLESVPCLTRIRENRLWLLVVICLDIYRFSPIHFGAIYTHFLPL